jgi:hypothetical protein
MSTKSNPTVATMGIDIRKNSFHVVGLDQRGAIVLRQKWARTLDGGCARRPGGEAAGVPRPGGPKPRTAPQWHRTKGRRPSRRAVLAERRALARFPGWPVLAGAASLLRSVLRRSGHVWTFGISRSAAFDPLRTPSVLRSNRDSTPAGAHFAA